MGRPRKQRRKPHNAAWHWKQTDCWYYTLKRVALFAENGDRIRGRDNEAAVDHSMSRGHRDAR